MFLVPFGFSLAAGRKQSRAKICVLEVFECRAAERIRAALDLHVHGRAACDSLVFLHRIARHDVDGFDRFDSRAVGLKAGID